MLNIFKRRYLMQVTIWYRSIFQLPSELQYDVNSKRQQKTHLIFLSIKFGWKSDISEMRISLCRVDLEPLGTQGSKGCQRGTHVGCYQRKEKFCGIFFLFSGNSKPNRFPVLWLWCHSILKASKAEERAGCSIENYVIRGKWGGGQAEGEVAAGEFILKVSPIIKLSN